MSLYKRLHEVQQGADAADPGLGAEELEPEDAGEVDGLGLGARLHADLAVGAIQGADHANTILAAGRADLCALARPHLVDPHLTLAASIEYDVPEHPWPVQYLAARPRTSRSGE